MKIKNKGGFMNQTKNQIEMAGKIAAEEKINKAENGRVFSIEKFFDFYCEQWNLNKETAAHSFYKGVSDFYWQSLVEKELSRVR